MHTQGSTERQWQWESPNNTLPQLLPGSSHKPSSRQRPISIAQRSRGATGRQEPKLRTQRKVLSRKRSLPSQAVPGGCQPHCSGVNRNTSPEHLLDWKRIIAHIMGCKGREFWDCTGVTMGVLGTKRGAIMEKQRDKRIKRTNHMSASGLSGHLSGRVLHLTSTV